jgi:hypothetical protein
VDRGIFSVECMVLLLALKINYPKTIILLRGNHECRQMTTSFTFRQEVLLKYDQEAFEAFCDLFDYLPLSCVINGKFIALHAGLSPELKTVTDINKVDRFHGKFTHKKIILNFLTFQKFRKMGYSAISSGRIPSKAKTEASRINSNSTITETVPIFSESRPQANSLTITNS